MGRTGELQSDLEQPASGPDAAAGTSIAMPAEPMAGGRGVDEHPGRQWWPAAVCCLLYVVVALAVCGGLGSLGASHLSGRPSADVVSQIWWLAWVAFALTHGHNVFAAQWQNYPAGANFGVNTSMLPLGIVLMPITKWFGPIVSWNIAVRVALVGSAYSMCLVLRRWTTWWPAAFIGGLLYGFSAYAIYFGSNLLTLAFVPLPPVIFLLLHEILVRQRWRPGRTGVLLGALCALQFFIWSEVLASTMVMGVIATALFLLARRHDLTEQWRRYVVTALVYSLVIGGVLLVLPLAYTFFGPQHIKGTPISPQTQANFPSDLFGAIVPSTQWLTTRGLTSLANTRFPYATDLYTGLPMLIVLGCFAIFLRRRRAILFTGAMAAIAFVISMGAHLRVDGHETPIPLPFLVFEHLPLLEGFAPARFSLYTDLFAAGMFAIGLDEIFRRLRWSDRFPGMSTSGRIVAAVGASVALTVAVVVPLVPGQAQAVTRPNVPSFFTSGRVKAIPDQSVVLAYPYPDFSGHTLDQPTHDIMLDQAVAGMRFKLIGGYGWFPSPHGANGTISPAVLEPKSVQALFDSAFYARTPPRGNVVRDLRVFLRRYNVRSVIALPEGQDPGLVVDNLTTVLGCPADSGGVLVWLRVPKLLGGSHRPATHTSAVACGSVPNVVTRIEKPTTGATVSGPTFLVSSVSDFYTVTGVRYFISGGTERDALVATAVRSPYGWLGGWNTSTVPNGTYTLRSVASDAGGRTGSGPGITITVKN